ncbi:hypothetical protein SPOG_05004 [Schizosaccharomyces cryophilus OY26]|uniref:Uncharacterized protein n=1 Tax=Schizosaccharomyces cryophilus (strain OY26 / ATCC MYA-4695 / CBS 11777 / NBRC 106824 / NRRL Y48691) TaxID=653667 RepID=S9W839_SCHCR|nr:uncharacterized protein SPOG_05004 [Schizosaccharomyces cryophilus OY26]EPY53890.1 hypothetical protein SPOG_05004 [Schizosaccharomyces cryophilus OY26]
MNASENSIKSVLWLIICPAKVARIPQATVKVLVLGGLFAVLAFWICMFVVSYLLDLFILLLDQLNLWIASILGFDTTLERNDLAGDNPIPLNTIPTESQNLSNDPNILADEQPSSECVEQFPERQQKPSQSRGVESTLNLESS